LKILLLGGTGAIGAHVVETLSKQDHTIVITSRSKHESKGSVSYAQGNAKDLDFIKTILKQNWDVIIDFMVYTENEFKERVDLFLESNAHYIFLSTSRVYDQSDDLLTEASVRLLDSSKDSIFLATSEYALKKAREENLLFASPHKNWTIIRPYITYSSQRLQLGTLEKEDWLYRALKGRSIVFSQEMMDCLTTLTYGLDVAKGITSILGKKEAFGQAYHITNNTSNSWIEIIDLYLDSIEAIKGVRPKVVYQNFSDFTKWNPGIYQIKYDRFFNRQFDNTKINAFIDTKPFISIEDGLKKSLSEFLQKPRFLAISWRKEAIKDRFCHEKTPLSEISGLKQKIKYVLFRYLLK